MTDDEREIWERVYSPITGRANHYLLAGQTPVPCSMRDWAAGLALQDRRVRLTHVGPFEVSTVFLGLDHNHGGVGPAILFETMTFLRRDMPSANRDLGDNEDMQAMDGRYATWDEAEAGPQRAVDYLLERFCHKGEEAQEITGGAASTVREENE